MTELYIPPCCISIHLPPLIRDGGLHATFYSQGDWGLQKLWDSVSMLVDGGRDTIFNALIVDDVDVFTLRYIRTYFERGWMTAMLLITSTDRTDIVRTELSDYLDQVQYVPSRTEALHGNLWVRSNGRHTLTILGPIPTSDEGNGHFCAYSSCYEFPSVDHAKQSLTPWRSISHLHSSIRGNHPLLKQWV